MKYVVLDYQLLRFFLLFFTNFMARYENYSNNPLRRKAVS